MMEENETQDQPKVERNPYTKASVRIEARVDKVTDRESLRYALGSVQATPRNDEQVFLTATNGRMMVVVPADGYVDHERLIPHEMLLKKKPGKIPHVANLNGRWESSDGKFAADPDGRFPMVQDVLGARERFGMLNVTVRLDAKFLAAMAEAMGSHGPVTLFLRAGENGVVDGGQSISVLGENGFGVLMPCGVEKGAGERFDALSTEYKQAKGALRKGRFADPAERSPVRKIRRRVNSAFDEMVGERGENRYYKRGYFRAKAYGRYSFPEPRRNLARFIRRVRNGDPHAVLRGEQPAASKHIKRLPEAMLKREPEASQAA